MDHCPGYRALLQRSKATRPGPAISPRDPSSSPTSPASCEIKPPEATQSPRGPTVTTSWMPRSSAKSPSGEPPPASTPTTHDRPDHPSSRQHCPRGNNISIAPSLRPSDHGATLQSQHDRRQRSIARPAATRIDNLLDNRNPGPPRLAARTSSLADNDKCVLASGRDCQALNPLAAAHSRQPTAECDSGLSRQGCGRSLRSRPRPAQFHLGWAMGCQD